MPNMNTEKKTRTPKNAESITKGALSLNLAERVKLKAALENSIEAELKEKENELAEAKKIVNGTPH